MSTKTMTLLIKPILLAFIKSDSVKQLIVDVLEAYVKRTDNTWLAALVVISNVKGSPTVCIVKTESESTIPPDVAEV